MRRSLSIGAGRRYQSAVRVLAQAMFLLMATSAAAVPRVYLAPLRAPNVDSATTELLGEQLLVSARRHQELFEVVGVGDVKTILDVEATRAALGCDTDSCANEVADALDADQLLAGQLGHIGEVWLLTLTRTDKATMQVLSRASVEAHGTSPEVLLPMIPRVVDEVLGVVQPPDLWAFGGGVLAGVGVLPLATGGLLYALSFAKLQAAKDALAAAPADVAAAKDAERASRDLYAFALIAGGTGGALVLIGATTALIGVATE